MTILVQELRAEIEKLKAENAELRCSVRAVMAHREGDLPFKGWLRDTDKSREALAALAVLAKEQP